MTIKLNSIKHLAFLEDHRQTQERSLSVEYAEVGRTYSNASYVAHLATRKFALFACFHNTNYPHQWPWGDGNSCSRIKYSVPPSVSGKFRNELAADVTCHDWHFQLQVTGSHCVPASKFSYKDFQWMEIDFIWSYNTRARMFKCEITLSSRDTGLP